MAMVQRTPNGTWRVRWQEPITLKNRPSEANHWRPVETEDGPAWRYYKTRSRTFDSKRDAEILAAEIKLKLARGERFNPDNGRFEVTQREIADAYLKAYQRGSRATTARSHGSLLNAWVEFIGPDSPASKLTLAALEAFADSMPNDGRQAQTRYRKVLAVEKMWEWAAQRPETFSGIGRPCKITGSGAQSVRPPPAVARLDAPSIDDIDRMIAQLRDGWRYGDHHRRIALLMRYTGLRLSHALTLQWDDIRPDGHGGEFLLARAGRRGAKSSPNRAIPLHPALSRDMQAWGARSGEVFKPPVSDDGRTDRYFTGGEATREAFRTAWAAAGVPEDRWGVSEGELNRGERAHGSPTNAIRAGVKVHLLRCGFRESLVDYLIGHSRGSTDGAYVPQTAPTSSPLWVSLREAVAAIPDHAAAGAAARG